MANNKYSYETKLEAVRLLNESVPGRKICEMLGLKSDGLIYTWRK
ncbi:transposase [Apilactobacillus kunkeei]|nr:transposase [Apilactobacillus kunkeei]